jgi:chitinase
VDEDDLSCAINPEDPGEPGAGGDESGGTTTITVTPGGGTTTRVTTIFTTPPITTPRTTTTLFITQQPEPTTEPKKSPDFSKDEVKCYDSGQAANRGKFISTVDTWCTTNNKKKLQSKYYSGALRAPFSCCDTRDEVVPVEIIYSVEVHEGCEWKVDAATCKDEFRKIIDGCDRNTESRKQGGRLVGDCMTWRVDPNAQS